MFMFGGNRDELVQESSNRIKSSIWILWRQDYRARNPETCKPGSSGLRGSVASSFLTIVVIKCIGPDESSFGRAHEPFSAVRVITRLTNGIIRHDKENKIL